MALVRCLRAGEAVMALASCMLVASRVPELDSLNSRLMWKKPLISLRSQVVEREWPRARAGRAGATALQTLLNLACRFSGVRITTINCCASVGKGKLQVVSEQNGQKRLQRQKRLEIDGGPEETAVLRRQRAMQAKLMMNVAVMIGNAPLNSKLVCYCNQCDHL